MCSDVCIREAELVRYGRHPESPLDQKADRLARLLSRALPGFADAVAASRLAVVLDRVQLDPEDIQVTLAEHGLCGK